ncbi:MAG: 1,4-alpha-glucan branching protein GlgB [Planctomycetota bacterium]|jgi:1,4-alpha-glucan branching enzyme
MTRSRQTQPGGATLRDDERHEEATRLSESDLYLFNEGTHFKLYEKLGAHPSDDPRRPGTAFAVWAPNAHVVSVIGDFNDWKPGRHPMVSRGESGIWESFVPDATDGARYKYHIESKCDGYRVDKADPFGFRHELPPSTASIVHRPGHRWGDAGWMRERGERQRLDRPISIYELHLGSWRRADDGRVLTYGELAPRLVEHVRALGFTHVELMPVMEHPFTGSWGYQITGYFAPTARYGTPDDFMDFVDHLHQNDIGVILDWVPSHFTTDEHGLGFFDGTHLYEHADPRMGFHPDWGSLIFNYGRHEVRSFLISNALFWLDRFHVDGLRVDAVASMLYLDYSRPEGGWVPNEHGGRENLEAIEFLRQLNSEIYKAYPDVQTIAEESTAWPMVSRPTYLGGLGFGLKWDMGWMHDTLEYIKLDPVHRRFHHNQLTFRALYQHTENYVLPLSHDEVVHGKRSLLGRMPGDAWQQLANLRLLLVSMWTQPGKKLLFMGAELGQWAEWNHDDGLQWHLRDDPGHEAVGQLLAALNRVYRDEPALHELDCEPEGFRWLDANDADHSVLSYLRRGPKPDDVVVVVLNFTPVPRHNYRVGVPLGGTWQEILNTDAVEYGGSGQGNLGSVDAAPFRYHEQPYLVDLTVPPLGAVLLKPAGGAADGGQTGTDPAG